MPTTNAYAETEILINIEIKQHSITSLHYPRETKPTLGDWLESALAA
ncbi:hypothetical protein [Propionivibrio sp.]